MNENEPAFFKALPQLTRESPGALTRAARESIYYWWWAFLRLSPVLWYARQSGARPLNPNICEILDMAGDLSGGNFSKWWQATGKGLFAEKVRPSKVIEISRGTVLTALPDKDYFCVQVPITIRQDTIIKQFKKLLKEHHQGRQLNLMDHSRAEFKLYSKHFNLETLANEYWVMIYRLLYKKIPIWKIGDRLQFIPNLRVRGVEAGAYSGVTPVQKLNSLAGRYYYKGRYVLHNLERKSFPNSNKPDVTSLNDGDLFAGHWQDEFLAMTNDVQMPNGQADRPSDWSQWIQREYSSDLSAEVKYRNKYDENIKAQDAQSRKRFLNFISGESDLLF